MDEKVISWAMIMDICGYEDIVEKIIKSNLKDARDTVKLLAKAIKSGCSKDIILYAHRLKGVAMTMGAVSLSDAAYRIEEIVEEKGIEPAACLFAEVQDEFEKVISFLSRSDWIEKAKRYERETVDEKTSSYFNN